MPGLQRSVTSSLLSVRRLTIDLALSRVQTDTECHKYPSEAKHEFQCEHLSHRYRCRIDGTARNHILDNQSSELYLKSSENVQLRSNYPHQQQASVRIPPRLQRSIALRRTRRHEGMPTDQRRMSRTLYSDLLHDELSPLIGLTYILR